MLQDSSTRLLLEFASWCDRVSFGIDRCNVWSQSSLEIATLFHFNDCDILSVEVPQDSEEDSVVVGAEGKWTRDGKHLDLVEGGETASRRDKFDKMKTRKNISWNRESSILKFV